MAYIQANEMNKSSTKKHTDMPADSWIETYLAPKARPYAKLMRLDRPIGIWLLLLPGWWAILLASGGGSGINGFVLYMLLLFGIGAVIMRAAGCIINDLWDRDLDKKVERTSERPLASGAINIKQASLLLVSLLFIGLLILLQMSLVTVLLGIMTIPLIVLYPLMKRFTWWPQAFLGITFNFGALMGWAAINDVISPASLALYIGGIFWTLGYDTIYAHQDKEDDMRVGIKSTAQYFAENSKNYVSIFYTLAFLFIACSFLLVGAGMQSMLILVLAAVHLVWQLKVWDMNDPQSSLDVFKSNQAFGLFVTLAAIL